MCSFYLFFLTLYVFPFSTLSAQCAVGVDAGPDLYLCTPPTPTQLSGSIIGDYLNFTWTPTTGLQNTSSLTPTVNVTQTTTYTLTATAVNLNDNSIVNGNFEGGNSGFTSGYGYSPGDLNPEGFYDVIPNPNLDHNDFAFCGDHTGGGNMMVVNGAGTPNDVWCQTINVVPNTDYVFSCWVTSVVSSSPALLQFFTNGSPLGPIFQAPGQPCVWQNFYSSWNSGPVSSVTICVVNQNTVVAGNDFALDDILFTPVCVQTDQVEVNVIDLHAVATASGTLPSCGNPNIMLNGDGSSTGPDISYEWTTSNGNIVSNGTTLHSVINTPGIYTLHVTYDNNGHTCTKTATVEVAAPAQPPSASIDPPLHFGCEAPLLTLFGHSSDANSTYQWSSIGGNIVGSATQQNININQLGQYELVVTNATTGCTGVATVVVTGTTDPPTAVATANGQISCLTPNLPLFGIGSSSGANITYAWSASAGGIIVSDPGSLNVTVVSAGIYELLVTNLTNGCTTIATVMVEGSTIPPAFTIEPPDALGCTAQNLVLSASGTPANADLNWSASGGGQVISGDNTLHPVVAGAGTYNLIITDPANGCTSTISTTVVSDANPPVAAIQPPAKLTCQVSSVTLLGNGSSTGPGFTYAWSGSPGSNIVSGGTTLMPTVNSASTYTLLVTNTTTACTATASVTVISDQNVLTAIANAPDTLTCTINSVALNSTGTSLGPTLTYLWTTTNGNLSGPNNIPSPTATLPGTYQLLVTNLANGCTATDLAVVVQNRTPPMLQTSVAAPGMLTCANPALALQGQNLSLPGNFTYLWTTTSGGNIVSGNNTLSPTVNATGLYTLTATNLANGCTGQSMVTVTAAAGSPTAMIVPPALLTCISTTQTLNTAGSSAGANFTYTWTTSNGGNIVSGANSPGPIINAPGTYTLLLANTANGCSTTMSVVVAGNTVPPLVEAGTSGMLTCSQPLFSLVANPNLPTVNMFFQWSTTTGQLAVDPNTDEVSATQPGLYYLMGIDTISGCTATDSVLVTANQQLPAVSIASPLPLSCAQPTITLLATATGTNLSYQWQTTGGTIVSGTTSATLVVSATGLYSLTVTEAANGCTRTVSATVVETANPPNIQVAPVAAITCTAPTQTILVQNLSLPGNFTYQWTATNGGHLVSGSNTLTPTVDAGGDYTLITTNTSNGCTGVLVVIVAQNKIPPVVNAGPDGILTCTDSVLIINGSGSGAGNLTYAWVASNGGHLVSNADTLTPTLDEPGTYTLLVTNPANGCTASDAVQVTANQQLPTVSIAPPQPFDCIQSTATLVATATGTALTYQWQTTGGQFVSGTTTAMPVVSAPGLYSLTVTDSANGCTRTATTTVVANGNAPNVQAAPVADITCIALTQVISTQNLSLPGNFTYQWTTPNGGHIVSGNNTLTPTVDAGGDYRLVTTNLNNGCTSVLVVSVGQNNTLPAADAGPDTTLTCTNPVLVINGSGSTNTLIYNWTASNGGHLVSGANTPAPTIDQPGLYTLLVTNPANGCTASDFVQIAANQQLPAITIAPAPVLNCTQPTATLSATATGNSLIYQWQTATGTFVNGANSPTPTINAPGLYSITSTDTSNGCIGTASVSVLADKTPPDVQAAPVVAITCAAPTQSITVQNFSLPGNFNYTWAAGNGGNIISGSTTLMPTVNTGGDYTLIATNETNGCISVLMVHITQSTIPTTADAGPDRTLSCGINALTINGSGTGANNLIYAWTAADNGHLVSGANTPVATIDQSGTYTLLVTNPANGCTATDTVQVLNDANAPAGQRRAIRHADLYFDTNHAERDGQHR